MSAHADRQISQMCKFILQEAKEKATEIRVKTEVSAPLPFRLVVAVVVVAAVVVCRVGVDFFPGGGVRRAQKIF